jgi:hypothetical protein
VSDAIARLGPSLVTALLAAGVLVGCGSSSSSSIPSHSALIARANAICREANRQLESLRAPRSARPEEGLRLLNRATTIESAMQSEQRRLAASASNETAFNEYVRVLGKGIEAIRRASSAEASGDATVAARLAPELFALTARTKALERQLGLTECQREARLK